MDQNVQNNQENLLTSLSEQEKPKKNQVNQRGYAIFRGFQIQNGPAFIPACESTLVSLNFSKKNCFIVAKESKIFCIFAKKREKTC